MKIDDLSKRIGDLSEKLNDKKPESNVRLDFSSFSDAEKLLFQKVDEVEEEYQRTGDKNVLVKNALLVHKNLEVIFNRLTDLYCYFVPMYLSGFEGSDEFEIVNYFFKLHFTNFEADLAECITRVLKWSEKDRQEFLLDLKKNGSHFFRVPRGFNEYNTESMSKSTQKERQPSGEPATGEA